MLELATNFRMRKGMSFQSAMMLQNGDIDLQYVERTQEAQASKSLKAPEKFEIEVPVWAGLEQRSYVCEAFFRYRVSEGSLAPQVRPRAPAEGHRARVRGGARQDQGRAHERPGRLRHARQVADGAGRKRGGRRARRSAARRPAATPSHAELLEEARFTAGNADAPPRLRAMLNALLAEIRSLKGEQ
jgi:hypothetical protein